MSLVSDERVEELLAFEEAAAAELVTLRARLAQVEAERDRMREVLKSCQSWIDRWTKHVGSCEGGNKCTCGRTAILYEASAALRSAEAAAPPLTGKE